jgi:hypothetical protein
VQQRLDQYRYENLRHRIRKQKKINLPSNCRPIDILEHPERFDGLADQLITIPEDHMPLLDAAIQQYTPAHLFLFAPAQVTAQFESCLTMLGNVDLKAGAGWFWFHTILNVYMGSF